MIDACSVRRGCNIKNPNIYVTYIHCIDVFQHTLFSLQTNCVSVHAFLYFKYMYMNSSKWVFKKNITNLAIIFNFRYSPLTVYVKLFLNSIPELVVKCIDLRMLLACKTHLTFWYILVGTAASRRTVHEGTIRPINNTFILKLPKMIFFVCKCTNY